MRKLLIIAMSTAVLALSGCAYQQLQSDTKKVIPQAEAEMEQANKAKFLWRDTGKILKAAKAASAEAKTAWEAGDGKKAKELAEKANKDAHKALKQAQLAQVQAKDQAGAGPNYPK